MATGDRGRRGIKDRAVSDSAGIRPFKLDLVYANTGSAAEFLAAKSASGDNSSSAEAGDFYYDSTNSVFSYYNGSAWVTIASPVGAALARGSMYRGSSAGLAEAHVAKTANTVLAGDGTDVAACTVDGTNTDATIAVAGGKVTVTVTDVTVGSDAAGDLLYKSSATALARLAKGTAAQILAMNGGATAPEWIAQSAMAVGTASNLVTTAAGDAAGDLVYRDAGTTFERLGIGTALQVLTSSGTAPQWSTLQKGCIQLPLNSFRELSGNDTQNLAAHGGILASDSTPILAAVTAGKEFGITWAAGNTDEIMAQVALPPDFDHATAASVHIYGKCADTPVIAVQAFFGENGTDAGGNTGALAAAIGEVSKTLTVGNQVAAPANLCICLTPGAHAAASCIITAVWIEYTRAGV